MKFQLSVTLIGPWNFMDSSTGIKSGWLDYFVLPQCTYLKYEVLYIHLNCFFMLHVRQFE
jgi:hypothetical protein